MRMTLYSRGRSVFTSTFERGLVPTSLICSFAWLNSGRAFPSTSPSAAFHCRPAIHSVQPRNSGTSPCRSCEEQSACGTGRTDSLACSSSPRSPAPLPPRLVISIVQHLPKRDAVVGIYILLAGSAHVRAHIATRGRILLVQVHFLIALRALHPPLSIVATS